MIRVTLVLYSTVDIQLIALILVHLSLLSSYFQILILYCNVIAYLPTLLSQKSKLSLYMCRDLRVHVLDALNGCMIEQRICIRFLVQIYRVLSVTLPIS